MSLNVIKKCALTALVLSATVFAGEGELSTARRASEIVKTIQKYHYKPRPVDDSLSSIIFNSFLESLDPVGCFFATENLGDLERYRFEIDDQIKNEKTVFFDAVKDAFIKQQKRADSILTLIGKKGVDVSRNDTLWLGGDVKYVPLSELYGRWEQWIKYIIVWSWESQRDTADKKINLSKEKTAELLKDAISWEKCKIVKNSSSSESMPLLLHENYLKAIATAFDPHTDFLSLQERIHKQDELSKTSGMFGIMVDQNFAGEIEIKEIVPGSPAWNSNQINEGDIILSIKKSDGTLLELRCNSLYEVEEFLSGIDHREAVFKIRKKTGSIVDIPLKKELIDVKQNIIRSFVLEGDRKIGYIYLPSFYTEFYYGSYFSHGCASDLSKELLKLKKDSINGLLLDLRGNGGGLVVEALRIAGLFIDYGALSITHERGKNPVVRKDEARGTVYDGPLVVLVNSASASASELLAATLQDHNRAIIAGSTTFGKGVMQTFLPCDAGKVDSLSKYKGTPPAFLSVTTGAIYGVKGRSNQCRGVIPDIALPDILQKTLFGEFTEKTALHLDTIKKKVYYFPCAPLPIEELKNSSLKRIKASPQFQYVQKKQQVLPNLNSLYPIPLKIDLFTKFTDNFKEIKDAVSLKKPLYSANPTQFEKGTKKLSKDDIDDIEKSRNDIQNNIYIAEAYMIINDLLSIHAKVSDNDKK